jgi:hypothetical protein
MRVSALVLGEDPTAGEPNWVEHPPAARVRSNVTKEMVAR